MALIDLTLKNLKFAAVADFSRTFGTKKLISENAGSLDTSEIYTNFALPYDTQRPIEVVEDSNTTEIQYNCALLFSGGTSLTLGTGQFVGCKITIFNSTVNNITITDQSNTFDIPANRHFTYIWTGSRWQSKLVYMGQVLTWRPEDKDNTSRGVVKGDFALDRTPWAITGTNMAEWEEIWTEGVYELSGVGDEVSEAVGGVYGAEMANVTGSTTSSVTYLSSPSITHPFVRDKAVHTALQLGGDVNIDKIDFDLSLSEEIYKNGASNHPKHIRVRQYQYIGV